MRPMKLRILRNRLGSVERGGSHLLNCTMTVIQMGPWKIDLLQVAIFTFMVLMTSLCSLHPMPLLAAEDVGIEALLELDPLDWASIYPPKVIEQCTAVLADKVKLKEDQVCRLYLLRGAALILVGKEEAAVRDLTDVLKIHPKDCQTLLIRSNAYFLHREYDKAQADLETLVKLQPKSGIGYAYLARCLAETGSIEESKKFAEKAIALDSEEPQGYLARAQVHLEKNNYQELIKDLSRCISLSYGRGTIDAARPFLLRASVFMGFFDNPKKALPDVLMARRLGIYKDETKCLFCEYYFKAGKYNLAFQLSEELPKGEESRFNLMNMRIYCLIERKRHKEALELSESMIRQVPRWCGGYLHRGEAFFAQKKYKDALQDYDKALSLRNDHIGAMAAKAYLLATSPDAQFRNGPTARRLAKKCCERTEYQVPRQLMLLAMACAECGDYKEAIRLAKESLEKGDSSFPFLEDYRQRLALFEKGKPYRFSPDSPTLDYLFP